MSWRISALRLSRPVQERARDRHLLIVSHDFPPGTVTGAQLPAFLARHAARSGWRVTVVCGATPWQPSPRGLGALALVPAEVRIVRAPGRMESDGYHPQVPYRFSPRIDGGFAQQVGMTYAALRALRRDPPSHLFATGPTFNNFMAACRLADLFDVPLTLQYRDEWTVMHPSFVGVSPTAEEDETRCLTRADLITFVTQGKSDAYRAAFPLLSDKQVLVASNGWDPAILTQASPASSHLGQFRDRLILTFTGRATEEIPLEPFLVALADVLDEDPALRKRLLLNVTGDQTEATSRQLDVFHQRHPHVLDRRDGVSQTVAMEILRESSALVLLNNTRYAGVVPLKTFDYMIAGTAILAFGTVGEAGRMIEATGAGIVIPADDRQALRNALRRLDQTPKAGWETAERRAWMDRNNRERVCDTLLHAMLALRVTPRR